MVHLVPESLDLVFQDIGKGFCAACLIHQLTNANLANLLMAILVAKLVVHSSWEPTKDAMSLRAH